MTRAIKASVCPHDCPSTCALSVEVLDGARIGAVRGADDNSYTAGVICAKVSKYAERIHHPDRLTQPLLRTGPKGAGQFRPISWTEALDRIADRFIADTARYGSEAVWPFYYAGTMGLVQRDGINRLRNVMRYSRQKMTICTSLPEVGWWAGVGASRGVDAAGDGEVRPDRGVGRQPGLHPGQCHDPCIARARKERGAKLVVIDPYKTPTAAVADMHLAPRPGTDAALACAVMHVAFRDGTPTVTTCVTTPTARTRWRRICAAAARPGHRPSPGFPVAPDRSVRGAVWTDEAQLHPLRLRFRAQPQRCRRDACRHLSADRHRRLAARRRRRAVVQPRHVSLGQDADRGPGRARSGHPRSGHEPHRQRADRRPDANSATGPQVHSMLIQNQNPLTVCPDSNRVRRGFGRDDLFVATHEQFMTETARWSDIVLPATMFMEHDDIYQAGGHSHVQIGPKLIEPPGECRSNHEVIQGAGVAAGCEASRVRHDRDGDHRRDLAAVRLSGCEDGAGAALDRRDAAVPDSAFPRWLPDQGPAVPFRARLGGAGRQAAR